jgi:hypothetical protein
MSNEERFSRLEAMLQDYERRIRLIEQRLEGGNKAGERAAPTVPKVPSLSRFINEKNPADDVQRSLVIGYYLEKHANHVAFNAKDLEKGFVDAREKVPGSVDDKILKNVWKGHMMQAGEDKDGLKAYALTAAGKKFVDTGFKQA